MRYIVLRRIFMQKNFENHEFLNGQNFSKIANVIYAINVPNEDLSAVSYTHLTLPTTPSV